MGSIIDVVNQNDDTIEEDEFMPDGDPKSKDSWFSDKQKANDESTKDNSHIIIEENFTFES